MKKKIIFITIESVKRELNSKILLSLKALKRNYRVVIGHKGVLRELIKDTNPGIMILKSFGPKNTRHIDFIKKKNFKVVSSDEELITATDFVDKIDYRMNNENLSKLDVFLAVGEKSDYPIIQKKFNSILKDVLVCGNIRLELLKKKYRFLLDEESSLLKKKFGNYILLLTAFAHINKTREIDEIDFIFNRIINENIDPDSNHIYLINEQVKMQREILFETIKFIDNFEKNFPNKSLVISPHPNERVDFWKSYIKKRKFKKIFVNTDRHSSSHSLINASEMLISSNSTSLLEAFFLDKKAVNLLGTKKRVSEIDMLKDILEVVRSSDELYRSINSFKENENQKMIKKDLKEVKNFDDDFDGFESILDKFDELTGVFAYDKLFINPYYYVINRFRTLKNYIKKIISYKLKMNPTIEQLYKQKIGTSLQRKNFIKKINHFNKLEKVDGLKIKQLAPDIYLLDSSHKFKIK